jgi:hypothetical protein
LRTETGQRRKCGKEHPVGGSGTGPCRGRTDTCPEETDKQVRAREARSPCVDARVVHMLIRPESFQISHARPCIITMNVRSCVDSLAPMQFISAAFACATARNWRRTTSHRMRRKRSKATTIRPARSAAHIAPETSTTRDPRRDSTFGTGTNNHFFPGLEKDDVGCEPPHSCSSESRSSSYADPELRSSKKDGPSWGVKLPTIASIADVQHRSRSSRQLMRNVLAKALRLSSWASVGVFPSGLGTTTA